jgi:hypothetical protein
MIAKRGVEGDSAAARASLSVLEEVRKRQGPSGPLIISSAGRAGSVTPALEPLRMASKLDPYRETARIALEPWIVEAALARLPESLSPADQRTLITNS